MQRDRSYRVNRDTVGHSLVESGAVTPLQTPPGHAERLAAHEARIQADLVCQGRQPAGANDRSLAERLLPLMERIGHPIRLARLRARLGTTWDVLVALLDARPDCYRRDERWAWLAGMMPPALAAVETRPVPTTKRCSRCRKVKSLSDFALCRRAWDGRQWWCLECSREDLRRRRAGLKRGAL